MSREIKFRAFAEGRIWSWEEIRCEFDTWTFSSDPIMQYTGLTDKNGKEIYENDVVYLSEPAMTYTVKFKDGCFQLFHNSKNLNDMLWGRVQRVYELMWDIEVIGNVFENPELIQS